MGLKRILFALVVLSMSATGFAADVDKCETSCGGRDIIPFRATFVLSREFGSEDGRGESMVWR